MCSPCSRNPGIGYISYTLSPGIKEVGLLLHMARTFKENGRRENLLHKHHRTIGELDKWKEKSVAILLSETKYSYIFF